MASASNVWKTVKAHIPLIRFRKGATAGRSHNSSPATPSAPSNAPAIGLTPRGTGIDESLLPKRYRRVPMSQVEIEVIERGGPDKL